MSSTGPAQREASIHGVSRREKKKKARSALLPSPPFSSPVSPGEVPLVARQRIVTGADSTNRRFHSCNVTRGSFCREHVRAYMRAYLISSAPRMSHKCARARAIVLRVRPA